MTPRQSDEKAMRLICTNKALAMWAAFSDNEKAGVRFGMFPAGKMQEAIKEGHDSRLLAVALMDVAKANGGMVA